MNLLAPVCDERFCDECDELAVVELHEVPAAAPRSGYRALCATHLTLDLLEAALRAQARSQRALAPV